VYRKQYSLAIIVFVVSLIFIVIGSQSYINFVDSSYKGQKNSLLVGSLVMILLVRIPLGVFANQLYFKKVRADIGTFIKQNLPAEYFTAQLRNIGGINLGGFIVCQGLFAIAARLTGSIG